MALGDGTGWDETTPTDATTAVTIDDYNRDVRKGIRARMALEHEFPTSQSATSEAGRHKYISFQSQAALPAAAISGTQVGGIYVKTQGLFFVNTASDEVAIVTGTAVGDGKILANSTDTSADYISEKVDTGYIAISGTNITFATGAVEVYKYVSASASTKMSARDIKMAFGGLTLGAGGVSTISNLPFADATSYGVTAVAATTGFRSSLNCVNVDGSACSIKNVDAVAVLINWIAIGV